MSVAGLRLTARNHAAGSRSIWLDAGQHGGQLQLPSQPDALRLLEAVARAHAGAVAEAGERLQAHDAAGAQVHDRLVDGVDALAGQGPLDPAGHRPGVLVVVAGRFPVEVAR